MLGAQFEFESPSATFHASDCYISKVEKLHKETLIQIVHMQYVIDFHEDLYIITWVKSICWACGGASKRTLVGFALKFWASVMDWPFQFWDVQNNCRIETKLEQLNTIQVKVHIIHDPTICKCIIWDHQCTSQWDGVAMMFDISVPLSGMLVLCNGCHRKVINPLWYVHGSSGGLMCYTTCLKCMFLWCYF